MSALTKATTTRCTYAILERKATLSCIGAFYQPTRQTSTSYRRCIGDNLTTDYW